MEVVTTPAEIAPTATGSNRVAPNLLTAVIQVENIVHRYGDRTALNGVSFEVHQAGTSTVLATLAGIKLNSGFEYTIWLQGLATPTNSHDGLSANILTNAYYN